MHPFASAIDDPELEEPEEMVRSEKQTESIKSGARRLSQTVLMTGSAPAYVRLPEGQKKVFKVYPHASLEDWHKEHGEYIE